MPKKLEGHYSTIEKKCEWCQNELKLNNQRDIERKRFCQRSCRTKFLHKFVIKRSPLSQDSKDKISKSQIVNGTWKGENNPNYKGALRTGLRHTEENKEKAKTRMLNGGAIKARKGNKRKSSIQIITENCLTEKNIKFYPEYKINNRLVDIFIEPNCIIECDGEYWHSFEHIKKKDKALDEWCISNNLVMIRLKECEIRNGIFKEKIDKYLNASQT